MKPSLDLSDSSRLRLSLQTHIEAEFNHLEAYTGRLRADLSEPLATCLQEYYEQGHEAQALQDPVLTLLLARSLWHLGEEDLAHTYLNHARGVSISPYHQALLSCRVPITPAIAQLVSLRVLRKCQYLSAPQTNQWTLDLSRLDDEQACIFELTRMLLLRKVMENVGPVFDVEDGVGILWIRRFVFRSRTPACRGVISGWCGEELRRWAGCIVTQIAENREWGAIPEIGLLEFSS